MRKLRQIWLNLCQEPILSIISIVATALSVFLMMTVVATVRVRVADIYPETNRSRALYLNTLSIETLDGNFKSSYGFDISMANELFGDMKDMESLALFHERYQTSLISTRSVHARNYNVKETNDGFWRVFEFRFVEGGPYTADDILSGARSAVIDSGVAETFFGGRPAAGEELLIDGQSYKVCGVVRSCSSVTSDAYSNIWIPYRMDGSNEVDAYVDGKHFKGLLGKFATVIMAEEGADMQAIRADIAARIERYNASLDGFKISTYGRPYDRVEHAYESDDFTYNDTAGNLLRVGMILLLLMLVPAINLSSMTASRLRRRNEEFAICRAFGYTRAGIVWRIVMENFLITVAAGLAGCLLSALFVRMAAPMIFGDEYTAFSGVLRFTDIISWGMMLTTVLLCFILNLLSSIIPALSASRRSISEALGGNNR